VSTYDEPRAQIARVYAGPNGRRPKCLAQALVVSLGHRLSGRTAGARAAAGGEGR
jgi:hypothetical protein